MDDRGCLGPFGGFYPVLVRDGNQRRFDEARPDDAGNSGDARGQRRLTTRTPKVQDTRNTDIPNRRGLTIRLDEKLIRPSFGRFDVDLDWLSGTGVRKAGQNRPAGWYDAPRARRRRPGPRRIDRVS